MQKDKRKKGCPNAACELHKKQVKQGVEVDYCPKCGTKTIFVCEKCFCEIQDIDEKHIICDRCEAERKQKLEETKEKGKGIAAKGGKVIIGFAGTVAVGVAKRVQSEGANRAIKKGGDIAIKVIDKVAKKK